MRTYDNHRSGTVLRARQLRRDAPEPERRLLRALRGALPNLKWRHQVPIGPFHADILCFGERLVIEVDGDTHAYMVETDVARTRFINREGYRVLRIANNVVMQNLEGALTQISFFLREKDGVRAAQPREKDEGVRKREESAPA